MPAGAKYGGRTKGTKNKNKQALSDLVSKTVSEFIDLKRRKLIENYKTNNGGREPTDESLNLIQPEIRNYDPVVEMSMIACNYENDVDLRLDAHYKAAQYLRPRLKSIEIKDDSESVDINNRKNQILASIMDMLDEIAVEKKQDSDEEGGEGEG